MTSAPTPEAALAIAHATRAEAAARLQSATAAVSRARTTAAAAQAEVERLNADERELIEKHSQRLEGRALAGTVGPPPVAVPADTVIAKRTAEVTRDAALQAVGRLEVSERKARDALTVAESDVAAATDAKLAAEAEAIAEQVEHHLSEAARLGAELRRYQPDGLHTPLNQLTQSVSSMRVQRVLEKLAQLEGEYSLNTPLNQLRSVNGPAAAPSGFLRERRAALIANGAAA